MIHRHAEKRRLPFTPEQIFDLVADVESYPQFLPWCVAARVLKREEGGRVLLADLEIGFKHLRERYTSRVILDRPTGIEVAYTYGPFRHLANRWSFRPVEGGTEIDFFLEFEFRSRVLGALMSGLFDQAVKAMVGAFERRAARLYRASSTATTPASRPLPGRGRR
jgi:coenzyme Q-binding protein COQ10